MKSMIMKSWCNNMSTWVSILLGIGTIFGFAFSMFLKQYDYNMITSTNKHAIESIVSDMKEMRSEVSNLKIIAVETRKSIQIIERLINQEEYSYNYNIHGALDPK